MPYKGSLTPTGRCALERKMTIFAAPFTLSSFSVPSLCPAVYRTAQAKRGWFLSANQIKTTHSFLMALTHPSWSCLNVPTLFSALTDEGGARDTEYF